MRDTSGRRVRFESEKSALVYARSDLAGAIPGADRNCAPQRYGGSSNLPTPRRRAYFPAHAARSSRSSSRKPFRCPASRRRFRCSRGRSIAVWPAGGRVLPGEVERLRSEVSRQLLANTDLPISQIAYALGYSAISAFSRPSAAGQEHPPANGGRSFKVRAPRLIPPAAPPLLVAKPGGALSQG